MWDTVELRIIGVLVFISDRVSSPNMKEMAMLLWQTHLCIIKYIAYEPDYLAYFLA